jgi:peptide/nickel transport system permease protein
VAFPGESGWIAPVVDVGFRLSPGDTVGIVGESGSGKTLTALAVSRLVEWPAVLSSTALTFAGTDLNSRKGRRRDRRRQS